MARFRRVDNRREAGDSDFSYQSQASHYNHIRAFRGWSRQDFLFTDKELETAMKRAVRNPSDIPRRRIFKLLFGWMKIFQIWRWGREK